MKSEINKNMSANIIFELAQKIHYRLFRAPMGYGKPDAKEKIDEEYQKGTWDFLNSVDELANYMVVVGYIHHFSKSLNDSPRTLDLGCGIGNVAELLDRFSGGKYIGLDISEEAIKEAKVRNFKNAAFQVGAFEEWESEEKFDFIISTGAIHYATNPTAVLQNYSKNLNNDGKFIISLWRNSPNKAIWRKIEKHFEVIDSTVVKNQKGVNWDIKVLRQAKKKI